MFVSEIYTDLKGSDVLGTCTEDKIFGFLSDAVVLISNQGILDPQVGQMDICVCDGCVTLPADVGTVLGVGQSGYPTIIRDQWYQYNVSGGGQAQLPTMNYTDELGQVCTFKDPAEPVYLVAEVEDARDSNKELRVFGWDENGKRIYTEGPDGLQDGLLVPTVFGFSKPNPSAPAIARIDRIKKAETNGFIRLLAVNSDGESQTLIGYYLPWETIPTYRRIRVPCQNWVRVKYKKKDVRVRSLNDWINIENREALILAVKAVFFRRKNDVAGASQMESESIRLINNEASAKRPKAMNTPQIVMDVWPPASGNDDTMFY